MRALLFEEIKNILRAETRTPLRKGLIHNLTIDSRQVKKGDLFFGIRGDHFDGNDFIDDAVRSGASVVVTDRNIPISEVVKDHQVILLRVDDCIEALGVLARFYRQKLCPGVSVVGVTGSNGKTTVREMIYHVMSKYRKGHRSPHNYNNQIGVPLTIFGIETDHEFAVVEIASNAPGEIAPLSRMAAPDVAVITSIGPSHLEGLKNIEGVSQEKISIVTGLKDHGLIVCGVDHIPTLEKVKSLGRHMITFGLDNRCDVYALNIRRAGNGQRFDTNDRSEIYLPLIGVHNVKNAMAALAVVRRLGITSREFAEAIEDFQPVPGRMIMKEVNGLIFIDDSYNANPMSMAAAMEELRQINPAKRRVLVCGDMYELGESSEEYHRQLGREVVESGIDLLLTVGSQAALAGEAALEAGIGRGNIMCCKSSKRMARMIKSMLFNGDVILVKGSRAMKMEHIVESLSRWKGRE